MKIDIFKYYPKTNQYNELCDNYFDKMQFADRFTFNKLLYNNIPNFQDEYTAEDDLLIYKTGNFDLDFSLLSQEKSLNGKSIYDFFYGDDLSNSRFLCIISLSDSRYISGIIDISSIKMELSIDNNKYIVSLSVIGIEKELFLKFQKTDFICHSIPGLDFKNFLLSIVFNKFNLWQQDALINIKNPDFLDTKCNFHIIFNTTAAAIFFPEGSTINIDTYFKGLLPSIGCFIKLNLKNLNANSGQFPTFELSFIFRTDIYDNFSAFNIISETRSVSLSESKFAFVKCFVYDNNTWLSGCFINYFNSQVYEIPTDGGRVSLSGDDFFAQIKLYNIWFSLKCKTKDVKIIDLKTYYFFPEDSAIGAKGYASFIYAFQSVPDILSKTSALEYKRLISGLLKSATLEIYYSDPTNMKLFNNVNYNDKLYSIERIKDIDVVNQTCKLEITEL